MKVKPNTEKYYHEGINKVLQYIDTHLDEHLDIDLLANIGCYSPFHFHRIMRAYLNEPIGTYVTRNRLEYAAKLLFHTNDTVTEIATRVGYDNLSSFSKAFKKRFDISPADYRDKKIELTLANSKNTNINAMKYLKNIEPKIKLRKATRIIYAQSFGAYNESSEKAWKTVIEYAKKNKLFGFSTEFLGISHDDPNITEAEKLRYYACITVKKELKPEGEIAFMEIPEGKYAIFTHKGPYSELSNSYNYIYGTWLAESGAKLRDQYCIENYLNTPEKTKEEKLITEIMIPVN